MNAARRLLARAARPFRSRTMLVQCLHPWWAWSQCKNGARICTRCGYIRAC